jgi:hypothetical protein
MRKINCKGQLKKKFGVLKAELRELEEQIAENVVMLLEGAV